MPELEVMSLLSDTGLEGDTPPPLRGLALPVLLPRLAYEPRAEPELCMKGGMGRSRTSLSGAPAGAVGAAAGTVAWCEELLLLLDMAGEVEESMSLLRSRSETMGAVERAWESWEEVEDRLGRKERGLKNTNRAQSPKKRSRKKKSAGGARRRAG
jgi:hypothetical protein